MKTTVYSENWTGLERQSESVFRLRSVSLEEEQILFMGDQIDKRSKNKEGWVLFA
jgi:hypothetical protein